MNTNQAQDTTGTAGQILNAAASEFAEKGYGGARMDEVARRAGVNKAAIYYHIGNKAALYRAVFDEMFGSLLDELGRKISQARSPHDGLRAHINTIIAHKDRYPHFAPIIMREVASGFANVPTEMLEKFQGVLAAIAVVIEGGMQTGDFRRVNPFIYHLMVIGTVTFYSSSARLIDRFGGEDLAEKIRKMRPQPGEMAEQLTDILLRSLRPDEDEQGIRPPTDSWNI